VQPRHVEPGGVGGDVLGLDLVEAHRRGVDEACARWAVDEHRRRHDRAGIEADGRAREDVAAAQGEEVRRAGAGADEVDGHGMRTVG
jgi:hypothetical protein